MVVQTLFLIACFATGVISSVKIGPCRLSDKSCIDAEIREAIPDVLSGNASLGVESSDPLFIKKIEANLSTIKYNFYNTTVRGYKKCEISNISLATDLQNLHYILSCNNISLSGKYEMSGRLVKIPIEGKGDYHLVSGKYKVAVDVKIKKYTGCDGKTHLALYNLHMESEAQSPLTFDFKNLYNGQLDLSDAAHKYAHENWQEVAKQVQGPAWFGTLNKVMSNVNKYLQFVAFEDMVIEEDTIIITKNI